MSLQKFSNAIATYLRMKKAGNYQKALESIDFLLKDYPNDDTFLGMAYECLLRDEQWVQAEAVYDRITRIKGRFVSPDIVALRKEFMNVSFNSDQITAPQFGITDIDVSSLNEAEIGSPADIGTNTPEARQQPEFSPVRVVRLGIC